MLRPSLAACAALSLIASPVLAQSAAAPVDAVARAGAPADDANQLGEGGWFPAALFATIVVLGVLLATEVILDNDGDTPLVPVSP
jgi:hypothetical protein